MPDSFMPDVEVHIAFNAGYNTPAASRVWTDVSQYVELSDEIKIEFGRRDERSVADANTLTLSLDNSDGRFTANRVGSPYYPNVKLGRPIRVRVTPPGGSTSTRFVGFVDEWPVEWDGSDRYARAQVRASSRLARLGLSTKLRSAIEQTVLASSPYLYWTMGDPAGSSAASESSGNNGAQLAVTAWENTPGAEYALTFGNATGPATDGLTAAQFNGLASRFQSPPTDDNVFTGEYLRAQHGIAGGVLSVRMAILALNTGLPQGTGGDPGYAYLYDGNDDGTIGLTIDEAGSVCLRTNPQGADVFTGPPLVDELTHDVVIVLNPGVDIEVWIDGVLYGSGATAATSLVKPGGVLAIGRGFNGTISHVALFPTALSSTEIAAQAEAVSTGFAGERTDERLVRALGWVGVPATEVDAETGDETMTYQLTTGMSAVDVARECEATESGVLFDSPNGAVVFHNRTHRYTATAAATLDMASQHVESDYLPKLDRSTLANDVTVENPTTDEKARLVDTTSSDEYGVATASATSVAESFEPLRQKAAWLINAYAEPGIRVPSLTVDVLAHQGLTPSAGTLLAVTAGDLLALTNAPTQADTADPAYFVEGYSERIGPESYEITFNLSPSHPALSVLVLDDVDRGLLDTGTLAL